MAENIFEIPAVKAGIVYPETPGEKTSLNPEQRPEETVRLAAAINLTVVLPKLSGCGRFAQTPISARG